MKTTAREYLKQIRKINRLIENKLIEIEQWKVIAASTTAYSDGERVQSSGNQQKMENAICIYTDIENEKNKEIEELRKIKDEVSKTIEKLPETEYNLLHKMYIGVTKKDERGKEYIYYLTLYEFAEANEKTISWAKTKHRKALRSVQIILDERSK